MSQNLNSLITPSHLMGLTDSTQRDSNIIAMVCPLCKVDSMYGTQDIEAGGFWWHCGVCKWSGPSISLYKDFRNLDTLRAAFMGLVQDLNLKIPIQFNSESAISGFIQWVDSIGVYTKFKEESQRYLVSQMPARVISLLESMGAWDGYNDKELRRTIGRFVGAASWGLLKNLEEDAGLNLRGKFKGFNNSLVMTFEEAPGKPGSFLLLSPSQGYSMTQLGPDKGICGLSEVVGRHDDIIVVIRPDNFLALQKSWFRDNVDSAPIVCAHSRLNTFDTNVSSASSLRWLHQDKVIFWDYGTPIEVVNLARHLGDRGYVATEPVMPPLYPEVDVTYDYNASQFVAKVRESATPWYVYLRDTLLEHSPPDAQMAVSELEPGLSNQEIDLIKSTCTDSQWDTLERLLSREGDVKLFTFEGKQFVERPGLGWFIVNNRPTQDTPIETRVSDTTISLNEVSVVGGVTYLSGKVVKGKESIPFVEEERLIRRNSADFVTSVCVSHELNVPIVASQYRRKLLDISIACKPPKPTRATNRVGWVPESKEWVFPRFSVKAGSIHIDENLTSEVRKVPGVDIVPYMEFPRPSKLRSWLDPGKSCLQCIWAVAGAILDNLYRVSLQYPTRGICLTGSPYIAREIIAAIGTEFSLQAMSFTSATQTKIAKLVEVENSHDLPVIVNTDNFKSKQWKDWIRFYKPHNFLTYADTTDAINIATSCDSVIIPVGDSGTSTATLDFSGISGISGLVSLVLAKLSSPGSSGEYSDKYVLGKLATYVRSGYTDNTKVLDAADGCTYHSPKHLWEGLLWSVFEMIINNDMTVGLDVTGKPNTPVVFTPKGEIAIRWEALQGTLKRKGFIPPDSAMLEEAISGNRSIVASNSGWLVPRNVWNSTFEKWKEIFDE